MSAYCTAINMSHSILERLIKKSSVPDENGCINWKGGLSKKGYGVIGIGSRIDNSRKTVYVHRISFELHKGSIPEGMLICHTCDNPKCVNPEHLFIGTPKDNIQDMINKNREANKQGIVPKNFIKQVEKVKNGMLSKLNVDQVKEIKKSLISGINYRIIANQYNVSASCIADIKRKATWINI